MNDLRVTFALLFNEDISVNKSFPVLGIRIPLFRIAINQIQLPIAVFYPVISDDATSRTVLQIISPTASAQCAKLIKLKKYAISLGIIIVLVITSFDPIVVNINIVPKIMG